MIEIRLFEDEVQRLFAQGLVRGSTHLCQGQEAVAVGACAALRRRDTMLCTYRGHGAVLAMGAPLDRAFGEILGKASGLCGGKGGSMHLTDIERGASARSRSSAPTCRSPPAPRSPPATAARRRHALLLRRRRDEHRRLPRGDEPRLDLEAARSSSSARTTSTASTRRSPRTTPIERLADRADAYAMAGARIDGNDVSAVYAASARRRRGPAPARGRR